MAELVVVKSPVDPFARAVGWFDIRDYGALATPNDIGPAVGAAFQALVAYGGGTVYIPPRADGTRAWGWATTVSAGVGGAADLLDKMSARLLGMQGQTIISVGIGQAPLCEIGHSNATVAIEGLTFSGVDVAGINASYVLRIRQARLGIVRNCNFYSLGCDLDGFGVVRIVADSTHVEDCIFMGCGYFGTLAAGGTLSIEGARDSCTVANCRFMAMDGAGFNGITADKSSTAVGTHVWFGDQGASPTIGAAGELLVDECQFDANAKALIQFYNGTTSALDRCRVRGCSLLAASNNYPAVFAQAEQLVVEGCKWGNFNDTQFCVGFIGGRVMLRDCRHATSCGKTVKFYGATTYAELWDCDPDFVFDTSVATPTKRVTFIAGVITVTP